MTGIVTVTPRVHHGLNKGGEDLYLTFACTVDGDQLPDDFEVHLEVSNDTYGYNVDCQDEDAHEAWFQSDVPYTAAVCYTTWHCDVTWEGDAAAARKLVEGELRKRDNWQFCHRPGEPAKLCFKYEHYVGGNAD